MTTAQTGQVVLETLTLPAPKMRGTQVALEVLRLNTATKVTSGAVALEVLRPNLPDLVNSRPTLLLLAG